MEINKITVLPEVGRPRSPNEFDTIDLKPLSLNLLQYLYDSNEEKTAKTIAEDLRLKTRQVDAATTRSLVRYGLAKRYSRETSFQKKEYNVIKITKKGIRYIEKKVQGEVNESN